MKFKAFVMVIACVSMLAPGSRAVTTSAPQPPSAFLPAAAYNFPEVVEGTEIVHDFIIINKGAGPLSIEKVETS